MLVTSSFNSPGDDPRHRSSAQPNSISGVEAFWLLNLDFRTFWIVPSNWTSCTPPPSQQANLSKDICMHVVLPFSLKVTQQCAYRFPTDYRVMHQSSSPSIPTFHTLNLMKDSKRRRLFINCPRRKWVWFPYNHLQSLTPQISTILPQIPQVSVYISIHESISQPRSD